MKKYPLWYNVIIVAVLIALICKLFFFKEYNITPYALFVLFIAMAIRDWKTDRRYSIFYIIIAAIYVILML
ncbi:hypothetical protein OIN60_14510 [Paenibacillus sp. P96]|uniref:Uncharacterized protein n=1 Tax=Paenibacillus zeirhizosphaerae TaxID=2987519 RepID=A0ABT9FTA7_9BACL|nr:hypothetical protein [Paenibacillus sp. P96]MDP4097971.1 hypothetical protein [Paenibacillus sp. P96]